MALNYLSIPGTYFVTYITPFKLTVKFTATSTDVECVFSWGRLLLSHIRNRLSSQSIQALMFLGNWSQLGLVKDKDVYAATMLAEIEEDKEELEDGWDNI